jgi:hypothetical protein
MSDEVLEFRCPRCEREATGRYYGPCDDCRTTLRAELGGDARELEQTGYEPKVNVTPNAVALKDD